MNNEDVCCMDCIYFRLDDEFIPYCLFEDECDIEDCEDSKPITERPKFDNGIKVVYGGNSYYYKLP